jgi:hypothetical protein
MDVQPVPTLSQKNSIVMIKCNCSCDKFYELPTTKTKRHTSTIIYKLEVSAMAKRQT